MAERIACAVETSFAMDGTRYPHKRPGEAAIRLPRNLGHGAFTTALIDDLHSGDRNGDGLIGVSRLAEYVEEHVPKLADGSEVHAAFTKRGMGESDQQSAHFGVAGGGW